jgi:serine/threonine-protein kinase
MFKVGQTLVDRFVLEAELGHGGMGQVFRANDQRLHRRIALKIIKKDPDASPEEWADAKARMLREARAAAALDHPNAVAIYDLGEVDGMPFIAMEFVPGTDLRRYVADKETAWALKLRWLVDVAHALAAAHDAGLVHRDVKPENVMLRENGRIKVLDFGIARRASIETDALAATEAGGPSLATLTGKGRLVGTPLYMAPEQIHGQAIDGRADQYAWGVMAFELLAGTPPFTAPDLIALMAAVLTTTPPPLQSVAPDIPEDVALAVGRTLSKSPADRFASMGDLITAIEPHAQPTVTSMPPSSLGRASVPKTLADGPSSRSGALAGTARTTTGGGNLVAATASSTQQTPRKAGTSRIVAVVAALVVVAIVGTLVALRAGRGDNGGAAATGSASASSSVSSASAAAASATAVTALPQPKTSSPAALAAYVAGIQAEHDAADDAAQRAYEQAVKEDAGFAAAQLRLASVLTWSSPTEARARLQKAGALRALLGPREVVMLDALSPVLTKDPPDHAASERVLVKATDAAPGDAELWHMLSRERLYMGRFADAKTAAERAVTLDPKYAAAWFTKGLIESYGGTREGALAAFEKCIDAAPGGATHCRKRHFYAAGIGGSCAELEKDARSWRDANPSEPDGYWILAEAGYALGKPRASVEEIVHLAWQHASDEDRPRSRLIDTAMFDILEGRFAPAEAGARELDKAVATVTDPYTRMQPMLLLTRLYEEIGDKAKAKAVANDYLKVHDTLMTDLIIDDFTVEIDLVPTMLAVLEHAGAITHADFEARLEAWAAGWEKRLPRPYLGYVWIYGYAATSATREDAEAAIAVLPKYEPLPWYRYGLLADALIGRTYLLAGKADEALPLLERGAQTCHPLEEPITWVASRAWLASAREKKGDTKGACEAYGEVVRRWGTTRSLTARDAKARMTALACKP